MMHLSRVMNSPIFILNEVFGWIFFFFILSVAKMNFSPVESLADVCLQVLISKRNSRGLSTIPWGTVFNNIDNGFRKINYCSLKFCLLENYRYSVLICLLLLLCAFLELSLYYQISHKPLMSFLSL